MTLGKLRKLSMSRVLSINVGIDIYEYTYDRDVMRMKTVPVKM